MKKRFLAMALAVIMVVSMLPMSASAASITESQVTTKLNELKNGKYKPGTKYTGSGECLGFAVDVFNYIFGTSLSKSSYPKARFSNTTGLKEVGHLDSNYTSDNLANLLKKAKPGDMLLIADPGKSYGHAMIIWSVSSSGQPTVYDANSSSANTKYNISSNAIDIHTYSTSTASQYHSDAATLYRYKDYSDGSSTTPAQTTITFSSLSVPSSLTVGQDGSLDGSITSTNSKINSVKAEVINSSTSSVALSAYTGGNFSVWTYGPIKGSKLDSDLNLGQLAAGTYYVRYTATTQDGTSASKSTSNFTVNPVSCNGNHTWGSWTTTKEPSCGVAGERKHTCTKCGQSATETIAALTHSYGNWTTVTEATCTAAGKRERTCANCKNKESETIDALGHDYQLTGSTVLENTYTCSRCKDIKTIDTGYSCDKDGHQWGRWETIEEPTCSSDGWRSRTCKVCGEVDEVDLPATGEHRYGFDEETTYYIFYICRDCGDLKIETKEPAETNAGDDVTTDSPHGLPFPRVKDYFWTFEDVRFMDWFYLNVETVYELGLMNGRSEGAFAPRDNMTIAEVVTLAARVHSIYYTGSDSFPAYDGGNWYDPYVNYARNNGIISENYTFNRPATREQVVHILAKALPQAELANTVGSISFADSIDITYMADVRLLSGAGVIDGFYENGSTYFKPLDPITRAQVAAIVGRMVQPSTRVG